MGDKGRKESKFVGKLLEAKKRRDFEKVLRDERKQEKERVAEGDNFKDKDVFVTSNYRKQIEKTADYRKQLENDDAVDDVNSVRNQRMWQGNFGKMMLDQKDREYRESREYQESRQYRESRESRGHSDHRKYDKDEYKRRDEKVYSSREQPGKSRKRFSQSYRDDDAAGVRNERGNFNGTTFTDQERQERKRRMKRICEILKKRNTPSQIKEARDRYLIRRSEGLIVPPNRF